MRFSLGSPLLMLALLLLLVSNSGASEARLSSKAIFSKLDQVTAMREGLAATLDPKTRKVTVEDFQRVCAPVGAELKKWAGENGLTVRQASVKFRNIANQPTPIEMRAIEIFQADRTRTKHFFDDKNGNQARYYFAPIVVVSSCLACHGEVGSRPDFISEKYPKDLAHSFKVGDLRGVYSVLVPGKKGRREASP